MNDAFGSAHRAHASTEAVARVLKPAVSGFLMQQELQYLGEALDQPKRPFVAVLGGAKICGKIDLIEALLPKVDADPASAARWRAPSSGDGTGDRELAGRGGPGRAGARRSWRSSGDKLVAAERRGRSRRSSKQRRRDPRGRRGTGFPAGWAMFDIDPRHREAISPGGSNSAGTVVWNGPMGVFETPPFDHGTLAIATGDGRGHRRTGAVTVVGGGDSAAAVAQAGLEDQMTHVSTGGGASLEFLEGKALPGVAALDEA